jgi:hypothetical protein
MEKQLLPTKMTLEFGKDPGVHLLELYGEIDEQRIEGVVEGLCDLDYRTVYFGFMPGEEPCYLAIQQRHGNEEKFCRALAPSISAAS